MNLKGKSFNGIDRATPLRGKSIGLAHQRSMRIDRENGKLKKTLGRFKTKATSGTIMDRTSSRRTRGKYGNENAKGRN